MFTYRIVFMKKDGNMETADFSDISEITAAGFTIVGTEIGRQGTWLSGKEYPKIQGFLGGMRDGDNIIRYETQEVYNILSN